MRELAHVSLRLEDDGDAAFFDDLDLKEWSRMEKEAHEVAENALIQGALCESSVARENKAPMAVAAGRERHEH